MSIYGHKIAEQMRLQVKRVMEWDIFVLARISVARAYHCSTNISPYIVM